MTRHSFSFTGNAKEYFGIWIVNLSLSIVTIGIYTAWAKVRRLRYFYANTHLDGHNFEYHANPKSILIGRIIVVGFLVAMNVAAAITPFALLLLIPYLIAFPWIINKSMQFNARVTSYRNIRFNFAGSYWRAAGVFIVLPLAFIALLGGIFAVVGFVILGAGSNTGSQGFANNGWLAGFAFIAGILAFALFVPYMSKLTSNYIGNNLSFGTAQFSTRVKFTPLLGNFFVTLLFALVAGVVFAFLGNMMGSILGNAGLFDLVGRPEGAGIDDDARRGGILVSVIGSYAATFLAFVFYRAGVRNIAYSATVLDGAHEFESTLERMQYVWILFTNMLATIATIGLLRPWAAIRTWRYLTDHTRLLAMSDLGGFVEQRQQEGAAASAEFLDIEGIDFGL